MDYSIEPIKTAVKKLNISTNRLTSSIEGEWNDEVNESYRRYISQCKQNVEKIRHSESKLDAECAKLNAAKPKELIASAKSVCRAIDEV